MDWKILIGRELQAISNGLDSHPEILELVAADLQEVKVNDCGRKGLPVESVLRCAILKQYRQVSYEELAFYLLDSHSFQAFARLPLEIMSMANNFDPLSANKIDPPGA